eukprot:Phypoly_transcript_05980.p1 GENE.Phypoly_transcript_05980~~Phypoly_transcript_05980.p1  ORF type:complete len:535 (+),score=71.85 Phypoly_transcript_05980:184-1788(+)
MARVAPDLGRIELSLGKRSAAMHTPYHDNSCVVWRASSLRAPAQPHHTTSTTMVSRFFTKNLTRHLWKETTGPMSYMKRLDFFKSHLVSSLSYLQECQERYTKLESPSDSKDVPKFYMEYTQISNLSNAVHYLTKYTEHIDRLERLFIKNKHAALDDEDDFMYTGASVTISANTLPCHLVRRKTNPHKHPLSDEQLDDYVIRNVATLMQKPVPASARAYLEEIKNGGAFVYNKFKRAGSKFGIEAFMHEHGYPPFLDRRAIENLFGDEPPSIGETKYVTQEFKDAAKLLADPYYLPKRKELYPVFPWLDPSWEAPTNPMPPPPFYPATWYYYVENIGHLVYELWTEEYINALAEYLGRRCDVRGEKLYRIVEIGAGDGRLTYFLRKKLDELGHHNIDIIATDTGAWESDTWLPVARVADTASTLKKYNPKMVICSWMVPNVDLTKEFRAHPSVDEYVLIGPPNGDISGSSWETWGHSTDKAPNAVPPYVEDGFQRYYLKYVSLFQIAQNSGPYFQFGSRTISFRRENSESPYEE